MDREQEIYQIVITNPAKEKFYQVLAYVYKHYELVRADEIAFDLLDFPEKLRIFPERGKLEENLRHRNESFRFILYKRSAGAKVKIIYFVDKKAKKVYVTDFFPTEMNHVKITSRS